MNHDKENSLLAVQEIFSKLSDLPRRLLLCSC